MLFNCYKDRSTSVGTWSSQDYSDNFNESCRIFEREPIDSNIGNSLLCSNIFIGTRYLQWEYCEGVVCLREFALNCSLQNSAVCIRFGASPILQIGVESYVDDENMSLCAWIGVVQQDGNLHTLFLQSKGKDVSILEQLVVAEEGRMLNYGGTAITSDMAQLKVGRIHNQSFRNEAQPNLRSLLSMCRAQLQSVPPERDVTCAHWVSHSLLLLGLSQGDTLVVHLQFNQKEEPSSGGCNLRLSESLLKDRGSGLQALWTGFLGAAAVDSNSDTIRISSALDSALAINRCGELRVWNIRSGQLVAQTLLSDFFPQSQGSLLLQDCYMSMCGDCDASTGNRLLIAALGFLREDGVDSVQGRPRPGTVAGLVTAAVPLNKQDWQVHLLAWTETVPASATEAKKPELVSQRIRFPLGTTCGVATAATYIFRSAALVDVQVTVDSASACVVITSVWRAEAVPANEPMCEKGFLFEALVGRNTVPLCELRAQHNILGSVSELMSPGEMVLAVNSAEHERLMLRDQDTQLCRHLQESWAAPQADLSTAEKTLKATMLQRIFQRRRYAVTDICYARDRVRSKRPLLALQIGEEESKLTTDSIPHSRLDRQQASNSELPVHVLDLCVSIADANMQIAQGFVADKNRVQQLRFLSLLSESFVAFLGECEAAATKRAQGNPGIVCAIPVNVGPLSPCSVLARRGGEHGIIYSCDSTYTVQSSGCCDAVNSEAALVWTLLENYFGEDIAWRSSFGELDNLVNLYLSEGNVTATNAQWVGQYFASLTAGMRPLLLHLPHNIDASMLEAMISCIDDDCDTLQKFVDKAFETISLPAQRSKKPTGSPATVDADMMCQLVLVCLKFRVRRCQWLLAMLFLLQDAGQVLLGASTHSAINTLYIPTVMHRLLHYSTLIWMDGRRPIDNHSLRYEVELADQFPLSYSWSGGSAVYQEDQGFSVLENFIRHLSNKQCEGDVDVIQLMVALQASVHSSLGEYLFRSGQYVCLGRWASVLSLSHAAATEKLCSSEPHSVVGISPRILMAMCRYRIRTTVLTCELFEFLRIQKISRLLIDDRRLAHSSPSVSSRPSTLEMRIAEIVRELLNVAGELARTSQDAINCASALSPLVRKGTTLQPEEFIRTLLSRASSRCEFDNGEYSAAHMHEVRTELEGLLSLADGLAQVAADTRSSVQVKCMLTLNVPVEQIEELCSLLHIASMRQVLEMIDRALLLLPEQYGAALAQECAVTFAENVSARLDVMLQHNISRQTASVDLLMVDLHGAWNRVFEYALLTGTQYGDALDALLRVAELEEQGLVAASATSAAGMPWRDGLSALVSQACERGFLGWMCSLPDRQLRGFQGQGLSLNGAIVAALEVLAATRDLSTEADAVNYYECLFVFQLNRHSLHDGANVMHRLYQRVQETCGALSKDSATQQVRALATAMTALAVLPTEEAFLLQKCGDSTWGSSSSSGARQSAVLCLSEQNIAHLLADRLSLTTLLTHPDGLQMLGVSNHSGAAHVSPTRRVLALCNIGKIQEALSFAVQHDFANPSTTRTVDVILAFLARLCVSTDTQLSPSFISNLDMDTALCAPYCLGCVSTERERQPEIEQNVRWHSLICILRCLSERCKDRSHYKTAVRALLAFHEERRAGCPLSLPRALVDEMCGGGTVPEPNDTSVAFVDSQLIPENVAELLHLLAEFDSLAAACNLATRLIRACKQQQGAEALGRAWMPYQTIDRLLTRCEEAVAKGALDQHAIVQYNALKSVLSHHFTVQFLASS